MKKWSPAVTTLLVLALMLPGLGSRHLWQDEIETAERARSILEFGYPRIIDGSGIASLNVGGWELEDSPVHRYSPWLQYYVASVGLAGSRVLDANRDTAVRFPFAVCHAATSGLVAWALMSFGGAGVVMANVIALAFGTQSIRVVHNRTGRYHALVDLLVALGILGLGLSRKQGLHGPPLIAVSILLLPHAHTLGGSLFSATLGFLYMMQLLTRPDPPPLGQRIKSLALWVALPAVASLAALLILSRPGLKEFGSWQMPNFRSLRDFPGITYALLFWSLGIAWMARSGQKPLALWGAAGLGVLLAVLAGVECYPASQSRYYLALPLIALLWPVVYGIDWATTQQRRWLYRALLFFCILPEMIAWQLPKTWIGNPEKHWFLPYQGVRLILNDASARFAQEEQPLEEAIRIIRERSNPTDPVLFDYVPQFANWYLPQHPIALMPDQTFRVALNTEQAIWDEPLLMPQWHAWYPSYGSGIWLCMNECDYRALNYRKGSRRYQLQSTRLGETVDMCVVRAWRTNQWNNAPFMNLLPSSRQPAGSSGGILVLARRCRMDEPQDADPTASTIEIDSGKVVTTTSIFRTM